MELWKISIFSMPQGALALYIAILNSANFDINFSTAQTGNYFLNKNVFIFFVFLILFYICFDIFTIIFFTDFYIYLKFVLIL